VQDIRYGLRMLRSHPGFTIIAVVSLALGIGANTAIFGLVDTILLRSLPVRHPEQLVRLVSTDVDRFEWPFSLPEMQRFREQKQIFQEVLATVEPSRESMQLDGHEYAVIRQRVSTNFFTALGMNPAEGRTFSSNDKEAVVISFRFWKSHFASDPSAVGKKIKLGSAPATIVGVARPEFFGVHPGTAPDVWELMDISDRGALMARLQPEISPRQARDAVEAVFRAVLTTRTADLFAANPKISPEEKAKLQKDPPKGIFLERLRFEVVPAGKGFSQLRSTFSEPLLAMMALVGLVLLIACVNIANLLLARAGTRRREIAVRLALGASRLRLVRQLLTESLLLAGLGGIAGLLVSFWATGLLLSLLPSEEYLISFDFHPDARILGFTFALSLLTGLLFGMTPAWGATGVDVNQSMKGAVAIGRRSWINGNNLLLILETAACLVLLSGAGLFLHSLVNLKTMDAGFNRNLVLSVRADWPAAGYKDAQIASAQQVLLQRFGAVPGVQSASLSAATFHDGLTNYCCVSVAGSTAAVDGNVRLNYVSPRYFETMGTRLLAGRDFNEHDTATSPKVAVISETTARRYFGNANPVGEHFSDKVEIVGVVRDAKYFDLREPASPMIYYPLLQSDPKNGNTIEVRLRSGIAMEAAATALQKEFAAVLPESADTEIRTLAEAVDDSIQSDLLIAKLSGFFGVVAMALACIGVYGVTSYAVARRTSEIGIRMALGAQRAGVLRMVLRESIALAVAGVAIGVPSAVLSGRFIASMLFGVKPYDPVTLALAAGVMLMVALAAGYVPARRAAAVDPMVALRYE
jgi:predicted permease